MEKLNEIFFHLKQTLWGRLHFKIAVGTTLFTTVILVTTFTFFFISSRRERTEEFFQRANVKADIIYRSLETAMVYKSPATARAVVEELVERLHSSGEFAHLAIMDKMGKVWVSSLPAEEGTRITDRVNHCMPCHQGSEPIKQAASWALPGEGGGETYRVASAFMNGPLCLQCHNNESTINGVLIADFPMEGFKEALQGELHILMMVMAATLGAMLFSLRYLLRTLVVKRIQRLSERTRRIGQGELPPPTPVRGVDELARIEVDFNEMCRGLIDQKRKNEELQKELIQREKLAVIGQLVAGIAHDFNTPLGIVLSRLECLKLEADHIPIRQEFEKDLAVIERQIKRLARTVQGLLSFSRHTPIQFEPVKMHHVIKEAMDTCHPSYEKKQIHLHGDSPADLPPVYGNPIQLEQMLINLLNNAYEAVENGGTVRVHAQRTSSPPRNGIVLVVEDNGPGFPEEIMQTLFLPFVTSKKSGDGTGLGLAIVSQIVSQHGGTLKAGKSPLGGAWVEICLPTQDGRE